MALSSKRGRMAAYEKMESVWKTAKQPVILRDETLKVSRI